MKDSDKRGKKAVKPRTSRGWTAKTHPKPNESPLWPHLELIRSMRLGRHTWAEIADAIEKAGGPKVALNTVYNFYKRVANRAKKGKGLPLGFEDPFAKAPVPPPASAPAAIPPPDTSKRPGDLAREEYLKNQAEYLKQKTQRTQNEPPFYIHKPDDQ